MRGLFQRGSSAVVLVLIMFIGSLVMWVGIPVAWLWVASQIQATTGSVGAAVGAALLGVVLTIALTISVLSWLSNRHRKLRIARGHEDSGHLVLEAVLVVSAAIAVVGFGVWFLLFAGTSPFPLDLSY